MEHPLAHRAPCLSSCSWVAVLLGALLATAGAAAAQPSGPPTSNDSHPPQPVPVIASQLDRQTLKRAAMQFVKLHGAASEVSHQIGRWRLNVCPRVTGLNPAAGAYVSRRVTEVARSVGAPTPSTGKVCQANVEIVFTSQPQQLLNHIAKGYPSLLGSSRSADYTTFRHAIQSWYLTGTRAVDGVNLPIFALGGLDQPLGDDQGVPLDELTAQALNTAEVMPGDPSQFGNSLQVDVPGGSPPSGVAGSYITKGLTSELLRVLVIVDTDEVAADSLRAISDYIAMVALTRMGALDGCSELPSIIDLLSSGCGTREKPQGLTEADTAYLKALYSSDLKTNLNVEQVDMRDRMVMSIASR